MLLNAKDRLEKELTKDSDNTPNMFRDQDEFSKAKLAKWQRDSNRWMADLIATRPEPKEPKWDEEADDQ